MPKRSNPFQQLIRLFHEQLHAPHAVVESEMLLNRISGRRREVDVVIHLDIGGLKFITSVECRDRKRPASIGWVEEMYAKHQNLPTNKLILVSSSGFTEQAEIEAKRYDFIPLTITDAEKVDWTEYVHRLHSVVISGLWAMTGVVAHAPTYVGTGQVLPLKTRFYDANGVAQATAQEIADALWMKPMVRAKLLELDDLSGGEGSLVRFPLAKGASMKLASGEMHLVESLDVVMLLDQLKETIHLESKSYFAAQIAYGRTHAGSSRELLLSIIERPGLPVDARVAWVEGGAVVDSVTLTGSSSNRSLSPASDAALRALIRAGSS